MKVLIADRMSVGFIHDVMNTGNIAISGETIDYSGLAGTTPFLQR